LNPTPKSHRIYKPSDDEQTLVSEVAAVYWNHAKQFYGEKSERLYTIGMAIRHLTALYKTLPAYEFSPKQLIAVRQHIIDTGDRWKLSLTEPSFEKL
jgi:hypothetical protein